jgi:membrane-bound lytic murein transglycosylase D
MPTKPAATTSSATGSTSVETTKASQAEKEAALAEMASKLQSQPAATTLAPAPVEVAPDTEGEADPAAEHDDDPDSVPAEEVEPSPLDELPENPPEPSASNREREEKLVQEAFPGFDIPMVLNDRVVAYVDYFSTRHRAFFEASLARSGRYVQRFQKIFEEAGIPKDLVYMAHVESAFKTNAYSRARAKGIFQFISGTGRRYGLRIDQWVDQRSEPEQSAHAAAAYLKDLYGMFGDWYLALAAYNAGEGKIGRSLAKTGKGDFWSLASTKSLRAETRNYVPAILAAALIAKQPAKYGFHVAMDEPIVTDAVSIDGQVDLRVLARLADVDIETMKQLNPHLRRGATPPGAITAIHVPTGKGESTAIAYASLPSSERMVLARHTVAKGESLAAVASHYGVSSNAVARANGLAAKASLQSGQELVIPAVLGPAPVEVTRGRGGAYRVQRGDTLGKIASRYRTSVSAIAAASGINPRSPIRVGQRLVIPGRRTAVATASHSSSGTHAGKHAVAKASPASKPLVHTVKRGETLYRIAGKYQVSVDLICALNNIPPSGVLYPGTRLKIRTN